MRGRLDPRASPSRPSAALGFALLTTAVGAASGAPPQFLILDLAIGLTYIVSGVIAWQRRPEVLTGPLLLLCGVLNFVGSYGPSERPFVTNLGFAFEGYYDVALAVLVLALAGSAATGTRPHRRHRAWRRVPGPQPVASLPVRSRHRSLAARDVPSNPFAIAPNMAAFETIETLSSLAIAVLALTVAGICLHRLLVARPLARRVLWPILAAGIVAMLVAAFDAFETSYFMATGVPLLDLADPWDEMWSWSMYAARLLVPIGFLVGSLRLRMAGGPLVALAVGLGRVPSPVRLQSALGAALGDPGVRLVRRDPDGDGWLTADGRHTAEPTEDASHAVTMLEHDGRPLAAIEHDPVLREDPALVGSVMAVLRLAVENERLDAALQSQLEEVRASRARLVQAGEDERRRLERDLHDGAQQRLVSVSLALQQARQAAARTARRRSFALDLTLQRTNCRRRSTSCGNWPAASTRRCWSTRGCRPPWPVSPVVRTSLSSSSRRPTAASPVSESAAYFTVAECLTNAARHAQATRAMVTIVDEGADSPSRSRTTGSVARMRAVARACAGWAEQ